MGVSPYINFSGTCREAVAFYAKVFGTAEPRIMTFGEAPPNPAFPMDEAAKKLVMHAEIDVMGTLIMFSDVPPGMSLVVGNNVSLTVQGTDEKDLARWFNAMKEGGKVSMELGPQPWSRLYGFLNDRFGIGWQFNFAEPQRTR